MQPAIQPQPARTKAGTYKVVTWGCQMNVEDSEQIGRFLSDAGFREGGSIYDSDVVLLNTCSVRKKPEDKAFSLLGVLAEVKAANPKLIVGVCGCMAQLRAEEIRRRAPHVDFVVGTANIAQIPALVRETKQRRAFQKRLALPERKGAVVTDLPTRRFGRFAAPAKLKAFVPIQYGCDKFCAFCIVPTTRGRERSRTTDDILREISCLAENGTKEVTLLGQTVNSYGKNLLEGKVPFARLVRLIAEIPGIERIRYTSPYPRDFGGELIRAHADCPKLMEHCHLPLQSGDDEVLRQMKRVYTVDSFKEIYAQLRRIPGMAVTTDIIVGFPGETEEQFENTLRLVQQLRFDGAFMFAYSPRPGTPAAERTDQIPADVKRDRLNRLIEVQNAITCQIHAELSGSVMELLIEGPAEKQPLGGGLPLLKGLSRSLKTVHFRAPLDRVGRIANVRVTEPHLWGFYGELCE